MLRISPHSPDLHPIFFFSNCFCVFERRKRFGAGNVQQLLFPVKDDVHRKRLYVSLLWRLKEMKAVDGLWRIIEGNACGAGVLCCLSSGVSCRRLQKPARLICRLLSCNSPGSKCNCRPCRFISVACRMVRLLECMSGKERRKMSLGVADNPNSPSASWVLWGETNVAGRTSRWQRTANPGIFPESTLKGWRYREADFLGCPLLEQRA